MDMEDRQVYSTTTGKEISHSGMGQGVRLRQAWIFAYAAHTLLYFRLYTTGLPANKFRL